MKLNAIAILILGGAMVASAPASIAGDCGAGGAHAKASKDIVDTAVSAGSFGTLVKAVQAAGLVDTLKGDGPFTVFAPTDEAFAKVPAETLNALLQDKAALTQVLTYHVVAGRVPAAKAMQLDWAPTVQGQSARVQTQNGSVMIDNARVIKADIQTSNGIIHVIDSVILPRKDIVDTAVEAGAFNTLVTAVKAADLVDTLKGKGPFTVFAPTDDAFAKVPEATLKGLLGDKPALTNVLTYHVIPSRILSSDLRPGMTKKVDTASGQAVTVSVDREGNVKVDGARVISADILAGNGVIHVIDSVILPPSN